MSAAFLAAAGLAAASVLGVRFRRPGLAALALGLAAAVCAWNLGRVLVDVDDIAPGPGNALMLAVAEVAALLVFLVAARLVLPRWRIPAYLLTLLIAFPVGVAALASAGLGLSDHNYRSGPLFTVHLAYAFALLVSWVSLFTQRQRDPSRHVRVAVRAVQLSSLVILIVVSTAPEVTSIASVPLVVIVAWITRTAQDWDRAATPADRLLDTIGVFVFVTDDRGELLDWNGPAASLLRLRGHEAERGLDLGTALGLTPPLRDQRIADLEIEGGTLRTELTVHPIDPLARERDYVLMFRPTGSTFASSPFPTLSGDLEGHDPATQTLGRRAAIEHLRTAAIEGSRVLRVEVHGGRQSRPDDLMFLVARRLEARCAELGWRALEWARLDTRVFVTVMAEEPDRAVPMRVDVTDLGISLEITSFDPARGEDPDAFVQRVTSPPHHRDTAQGS